MKNVLFIIALMFSVTVTAQIELETWASARVENDLNLDIDIFAGKTFDSGIQIGLVANYGTDINFDIYDRQLITLDFIESANLDLLVRFQGILTSGLFKNQDTFEMGAGLQYRKELNPVSFFAIVNRTVPDNRIFANFGARLRLF